MYFLPFDSKTAINKKVSNIRELVCKHFLNIYLNKKIIPQKTIISGESKMICTFFKFACIFTILNNKVQ